MAEQRISERAISLPFKINPYGNISYTTSQDKIWADRVKSVLNTRLNERVMLSGFGTSIAAEIFGGETEVEHAIQAEITRAFNAYLIPLTLNDISITFDENQNNTTVEVQYSLPDGKESSVAVGSVSIFVNNVTSEDNI